jgi:hypothetical protein
MTSQFVWAPFAAIGALAACTNAMAAMQPVPRFTAQIESEAAASQARMDFGGPTATLTPVDGVSLTLPKGWIACDDASNAKLGDAGTPSSIVPKICSGPRSGGAIAFGAFDPAPSGLVAVFTGREANDPAGNQLISQISERNLASLREKTCPLLEKPIVAAGASIVSCSLDRAPLARHAALVYRIVFAAVAGSAAQSEVEDWAVQTDDGIVDFNLTWSLAAGERVKPVLDAIRASLEVK